MVCSPPGSSVHGILQARILEWVAISFSRGSSWPRNQTRVSCIAGRWFTNWAMREAPILSLFLVIDAQGSFLGPLFPKTFYYLGFLSSAIGDRCGCYCTSLKLHLCLWCLCLSVGTSQTAPVELDYPVYPHNSPAMNFFYSWTTNMYFLMPHSFNPSSIFQLSPECYIKDNFIRCVLLMCLFIENHCYLFGTLRSNRLGHITPRYHWQH